MERLLGAIVLVLAGCSLPHPAREMTAEETFKNIEETVLSAKTVSVKFGCQVSVTAAGAPMITGTTGTLILKEGNKASISALTQVLLSSDKQRTSFISDGTKTRLKLGEAEVEGVTPKALNISETKVLVRIGVAPAAVTDT